MIIIVSTKAPSSMIKNMVMGGNISLKEPNIRGSTSMANLTEEANSFGQMESSMMANGIMVSKMAKDFGKEFEVTHTSGNGKWGRPTAGVPTFG